jgi:hypothetical protein
MACQCNQYFTGTACEKDNRACSSFPCLNNATCNNINTTKFECICSPFYVGIYCENKINACENITCSLKGYCIQSQLNTTSCKCHIGYLGENCEIEQPSRKFVTGIQITSLVILFLCVSSIILIVVLNDVWNYYVKASHVKNKKKNFLERITQINKTNKSKKPNFKKAGLYS